jgi:mortality factor 4-like protein 1
VRPTSSYFRWLSELLTNMLSLVTILTRWDEWVGPSRLLKHNEQGIALQKSLQAQAKESTSAASKTAKAAAAASTSVAGRTGRKDGTTRGTKRGRDEV